MIIDHVGFNVTDFPASKAFLVQALAPLGIGISGEGAGWAMLGRGGRGQSWFGSLGASPGRVHVAFAAENREQVCQFHRAAIAAGGRDNGAPGLRAHYHANDYGAFVLGPDGHNSKPCVMCQRADPSIEPTCTNALAP